MDISIDVGGTFTDFIILDEDGLEHFKVPSTPEQPEKGVGDGFSEIETNEERNIFHGTTVATNAFLEEEGVRTVFITNRGFEDVLFIGRQQRPELYDLHVEKPKPPLNRKDCFGISGRIGAGGKEIEPVDTGGITDIAKELQGKDVCASVCLLHSYADPSHERKVGKILREHGIRCSLSHRVSREYREYERGMTTLMDAYLKPIVEDYFSSLEDILGDEPLIMKSSGDLDRASEVDPVDTFYSGPAGGARGGVFISSLEGVENIVTFDMGGTSADMAAVIDQSVHWKDSGEIGDFSIQAKMVDIVTVGSGGGSIARVDKGGALRVGPQSAGAEPGPICYGRGGEEPTLTDALLLMGYIDPDYFLGGRMELEEESARAEIERLSDRAGMGLEETLLGIHRVANSKMARTMKTITVEKGLDPEEFSILAFGGAGGLHAASLADELGISRVMIPPMAGVFSAVGILAGDIVKDHSRTLLTSLDDKEKIEETVRDLREESGVMKGEEQVFLGLRYQGQSYHLNLPYDGDESDIRERFHRRHEERYGHRMEGSDIEVVRVHLEQREKREKPQLNYFESSASAKEGKEETRRCLFNEGWKKTDIYRRKKMESGKMGSGPAVIEEDNSTTLVPPGWDYRVKDTGVIVMENEEREDKR